MHHFDETAQRTARACLDYAWERLQLDPAPLDHPVSLEELARQAGATITAEGRDPEDVLRVFTEVLAPACLSSDSPRFLAFIPAAPTKASLVFDTVVAASSICATSWLEASGAVYAENEALRFLADLADLPASAGGCFVSGGSAGNLSALFAARETASARARSRSGRWRIAVGEEAHSSIASTLRILDCEPLLVPTGPSERMNGDSLRAVLHADPDPGSVCAIAATAGTTNAGIVDDLAGLAAVARERNLWLHVDGAYGGAALAAPTVRDRFAGIEHADSLVVDPHKWLFAPFDSCALLYRDPELARSVHAQHASYLDPMRLEGAWNPADYAYHLSRRARGLPFWFSLAVHGTDAYADAIDTTLAVTREAVLEIRRRPYLDLILEPELTVIVFRRHGWTSQDYDNWSARLIASGRSFVVPTRYRGQAAARLVIVHPRTTIADVAVVLDSMA